jgi:hypothetical protein
MKPYGIGSLPSASWRGVRGRESGLLQVARPETVASLQRSIEQSTVKSAREFFSPAFRVEAPGYGIAPLPNQGSPVAAMRGGLAGLDGWWSANDTCAENGMNWDDVRILQNQIKLRLDRVSPGIKATCAAILTQTDPKSSMPICQRISLLQQALSAAINDIRAQEGNLPKDASGAVVRGSADSKLPSDVNPAQVTKDSVPDAGFLPMVFPNGWSNPTRYVITAGVAAVTVGLITGVIALGGRK